MWKGKNKQLKNSRINTILIWQYIKKNTVVRCLLHHLYILAVLCFDKTFATRTQIQKELTAPQNSKDFRNQFSWKKRRRRKKNHLSSSRSRDKSKWSWMKTPRLIGHTWKWKTNGREMKLGAAHPLAWSTNACLGTDVGTTHTHPHTHTDTRCIATHINRNIWDVSSSFSCISLRQTW